MSHYQIDYVANLLAGLARTAMPTSLHVCRADTLKARNMILAVRDLRDWLGNRAEAGRAPPKGFPKNNRFG
jgi:hypothetical protein